MAVAGAVAQSVERTGEDEGLQVGQGKTGSDGGFSERSEGRETGSGAG
jgi:hypothetical protein